MNKRQTKRMKRNAAKAPRWVRDIAAATFDPQGKRKHREALLGTFGAASEARHIDPSAYTKGVRCPQPIRDASSFDGPAVTISGRVAV